MQSMRIFLIGGLFAAALAGQNGDEFFEKRIRPVLAEKCYSCHSSKLKTPLGNLRVDTKSGLLRVVNAGKPDGSRLYTAITYQNLDLRMPPTGKLPDEQIADFRRWIEMGAPNTLADQAEDAPQPAASTKGKNFWAFQPVRKAEPPAVRDAAWPRNEVDRFLLAKLEAKGLKPAAEADRRSWIRRATFDLTGLPPTPEEVQQFVEDRSGEAFEKVVERLLASPHYGERWARHWLDLVRFAETNGHEFDNDKLDAWRYRDYVIRAFNEDVPYDQFAREHWAGDLLRRPRISQDGTQLESPLGTSPFWFGEVLNSATDSLKSRADAVDNQIDVLGKTFLGLTVACARCHDHKFDPIPTRDYYALAGVMHSTAIREAVIDSPARMKAVRAAHEKIIALNRQPKLGPSPELKLREGEVVFEDFATHGGWLATGEAFRKQWEPGFASSLGGGTTRVVGSLTSTKFRMPKFWVHVRIAGQGGDRKLSERSPIRFTLVADDYKSVHFVPSGKPGFRWVSARMTLQIGRMCYFELVDRDPNGWIAIDKIVFSDFQAPPFEAEDPADGELEPELRADAERAALEKDFPKSAWGMTSRDEDPHDVKLHIRGSHKNLGEAVPRGALSVIPANYSPIREGSGRVELANWVASPANPLTARVMVNRIWKHHFGYGLVRTADNFGATGERPSNPELLDWLAARFVESGWSVKAVHRLIVLSSAYRMSSQGDPRTAQVDPRNDLLQHFPVRRLEAEAIRDSVLAISGRLDPALFGPSIVPHISKYQEGRGKPKSGPLDGNGRRSLYIQVRRNFITPMFLAFDYPPPISTIGSRGVSTVPSQALLMLNNEFIAEQAHRWADRICSAETDLDRRLDRMYLEAFSRTPEDWERRETLAFARERGWGELAHVLFNSAEFLYVR